MTVPFAMLMARLVPTSDYNLLYLQVEVLAVRVRDRDKMFHPGLIVARRAQSGSHFSSALFSPRRLHRFQLALLFIIVS
jgi:hypothetical protein